MMFKDYFDAALCINLDRRSDRWDASKEQFKKINLFNVKRVAGIDGDSIPTVADLKPGANGCRLSHAKTFTIAKNNNYGSFLLLEDDVEFHDNFDEIFSNVCDQIPKDWDMLYLCANPATGSRREISPNIYKISEAYAAHCVIFKHTTYDDAIERLTKDYVQADITYGRMQSFMNAYLIRPHLAFQRKDFSDIEKEVVDYGLFRV